MNNQTLLKYALYFINDSSLKENVTVSYCYNQNINVSPDKIIKLLKTKSKEKTNCEVFMCNCASAVTLNVTVLTPFNIVP